MLSFEHLVNYVMSHHCHWKYINVDLVENSFVRDLVE
jgi:hypothetical protein